MARDLLGLKAWEATNSPGEPVCVTGTLENSEGLVVDCYLDNDGVLRGVQVFEHDDPVPVARAGWLPAAVLDGLE